MRQRRIERGQAVQLGALFLFGFAILGLAAFQLYTVPAQNEAVEFNHERGVRDDLGALRSAVLNAGADGAPRSVTVSKGTSYPARFLLSNPSPPAGSFRTISTGSGAFESTTVDFTEVCGLGEADRLTANHVVYEPAYNYYGEESPHRYENTVYYQEGGVSLLNRTGQVFVRPAAGGAGGTVSLYPIQGSFDAFGSGATTVQFVGGRAGSDRYADFDLTVPTRISPTDWERLIGEGDVTVTATGAANTSRFSFTGVWTVECVPIGVDRVPTQARTDANRGDGGEATNINANSTDGVVLVGAAVGEEPETVAVRFENRDAIPRAVEEARFAFYAASSQGSAGGETPGHVVFGDRTHELLGPYRSVDEQFDAGERRTLDATFYCDAAATDPYRVGVGDYFVLSALFEDGQSRTYFVAFDGGESGNPGCESSGGGPGNGGPP